MKNTLSILLIFFGMMAYSNTEWVDIYKTRPVTQSVMRIPMAFDSDSLLRRIPFSHIGRIYQIDYVATANQGAVGNRQKQLDQRRWNKLKSLLSMEEEAYKSYTYYQTRFKDEAEASKLFHGFVIYYNKPESMMHAASKTLIEEKMSLMFGESLKNEPLPSKIIDSVFVGTINGQKKERISRVLERDNLVLEWHYDSVGADQRFYNAHYFMMKVATGIFTVYKSLKSTGLIEQLNRNRYNSKTLIVTDMTGSMYPYYEQLLVWHAMKLNGHEKIPFVFFNDGDAKSTMQKRIGDTGGLYATSTNKSVRMFKIMHECMKKGGGGDAPENNLEAVLHGLAQFEEIEKVILICDNWAYPRDASLYHQIRVPVEFVMCGTDFGVNVNYLNLAAKMQGAQVTTIEKSIAQMDTLTAGDAFNLGAERIQVDRKGMFVSEKRFNRPIY